MTYQEKKNVVNILSSLVITGAYFWYIIETHHESGMSTDELLKFWAKSLLVLIPVRIVSTIAIHILFAIGHKIATNEDMPSIEDERDKLIELKSTRISHYVFSAGFMLAMVAMAMDFSVNTMFVLLICGGLFSELFENTAQMYFHRKGI